MKIEKAKEIVASNQLLSDIVIGHLDGAPVTKFNLGDWLYGKDSETKAGGEKAIERIIPLKPKNYYELGDK